MIAMGAKELLQIVISAWQLGEAITEKQTRPVAARNLHKVIHGWCQGTGCEAVASHGAEQALQASFNLGLFDLGVIGEQMRCSMHPTISRADVWPQHGGLAEAFFKDGLEASQGLGQAPLFSTRSRLWSMA
jgi:hypothetical protein